MTALTPEIRERQRFARSRAGRIREGITNYLETLGVIAQAYQERDWESLGYDGWDAYVDGEFGADRLRLSPEHRQKAISELRLAGLSVRAISAATGVPKSEVGRAVAGVPGGTPEDTVRGVDGKTYPARSPIAEAMEQAIEDATERAADHHIEAPEPGTGESLDDAWSDEELALRKKVTDGYGLTVVASFRGHHENLIRWAEETGRFVRVDRRTEWGNPFEMPGDGDRATVIRNYAVHYIANKPSLLAKVNGLRGKVLTCWCAPEWCHAHVIRALAESNGDQALSLNDGLGQMLDDAEVRTAEEFAALITGDYPHLGEDGEPL